MNNESDSLQYVTSHDFMIKDIASDKHLTAPQTKSIFPPNKITKEFVLFTRLRPKISNDIPGESIQLIAKLKLGTRGALEKDIDTLLGKKNTHFFSIFSKCSQIIRNR